MKIRLITITALALCLAACCRPIQRDEPSFPKVIAGWKEYQDQGVKMLGNFVLRKGESIDNGKVQIRLLEVVPGNPCADAGEFQYQARAKIQFISLPDHSDLCADLYAEHSSSSFSGACESKLGGRGVSYVRVIAINLKDGWVFLGLG